MNIIILNDYQNVVKDLDAFSALSEHNVHVFTETLDFSDQKTTKIAQSIDVLVLIRERTIVDAAFLSHFPNLKLISQTGKKSNHLDMDAITKAGVAVSEGIGSPTAPSELCWALIMAARRHLPAYISYTKQGQWQQSGLGLGRKLAGDTLGIWGYGKIGKHIARYATAFDMKVLVWGSDTSRQKAVDDGHQAAISADEFFSTADIVSLHLRLHDATRGIVKLAHLQQMKSDALLVNISRAELIEPDALVTALKSSRPGFAAIDVFESEPALLAHEPLLSMPNVVCTPHLGYVEQHGYELYFEAAFENIIQFAAGNPTNIANPDVL